MLGASGFLGSWVIRALAAQPDIGVVAVVRLSSDTWRIDDVAGARVLAIEPHELGSTIEGLAPDVIVSLDWAGVDSASRDTDIQWTNLERQRLLVAAAAASGVRRIVGVGSQAEYGPRSEPSSEQTETRPVTSYGKAKVAALQQLRDLCSEAGLEWVWARVFSVYGPMDNAGLLLHTIATGLEAGRVVELSSGTQLWSYLFASDAASAFLTLVTNVDASGIYNVGHPDAPPLRTIIEEFSTHFATEGALQFSSAPSTAANLVPVMDRLLGLGWRPSVPIDAGLADTARWLKGLSVDDPFAADTPLPAGFPAVGP